MYCCSGARAGDWAEESERLTRSSQRATKKTKVYYKLVGLVVLGLAGVAGGDCRVVW